MKPTETQRSSHTAESDEQKGVGVRVGATPEPRWVQVMRAEVAETKHFKVGSVTHLYEMAVAFYDEFARAALRAPEPLTAALRSIQHIAENDLRGWSDWDRVASMCRAALEGGVSRTEPALTDLLVEARGWFVADPANPIGVILKDARGERIRDWLIEVDRVIATKSHPSGDQESDSGSSEPSSGPSGAAAVRR